MEITNKHRGRTTLTATVNPMGGSRDKDIALSLVMASFGENKSSLFGWSVVENMDDDSLTVSLYTD